MNNEYKMVMYSDGGCRPFKPHGDVGGWGVHGYIAELVEPKKGLGLGGIVATEKGYLNKDKINTALPTEIENTAKAVADVSLPDTFMDNRQVNLVAYLDGCGALLQEPTNNKAELKAFIEAANYALVACKHGVTINDLPVKPKSVLILADSKYVVEGFKEYLEQWRRNQWRASTGNQIKNIDYWTLVGEIKDQFLLNNIEITVSHVYGHSGNYGNESADALATNGIILGRKKDLNDFPITLSPVDKYWANGDYNRFLCAPNLYFNCHVVGNDISNDGRHVYYIGDHDKDNLLAGKPIASNTYGVLYLKNTIPELEMLKVYQDANTPFGRGSLVFGKLDTIFSTKVLTEIRKNGNKFIHRDPNIRNNDLQMGLYPKHISLTEEMYPPRMGFAIMDKLNELEDKLETYLKNRDLICVTDITDKLFETEVGKKTTKVSLRKEFGVTVKSVKVNVQYVVNGDFKNMDLVQTFGIDLLPRNDLSALASSDLRVKVITWPESAATFRYACIVETADDIAIYCAGYSNRMVIQ